MQTDRIISEQLSTNDIQAVLNRLGIDKKGKGWQTIKSPLRDEKNASFSINFDSGAWKDHGTDDKGDIVTLTERILDKNNTDAIKWIKEKTNISSALYSPPKSNGKAPQPTDDKLFWSNHNKRLLKQGQKRLNEGHKLVKTAQFYDQLSIETLKHFGVGIIEQYGKEWLALPYKTGIQLYRRSNGDKEIRCIKGSKPGQSFFGSSKVSGDKKALYIAKSPRETVLSNQMYGSRADVIGLATGEIGQLSNKQFKWLKTQISESQYESIAILLDCDSEPAYITAKSLADEVKEAAGGIEVSLLNIDEFSGGAYKDLTDIVRAGANTDFYKGLFDNREVMESKNNANRPLEQTDQTNKTKLTKYSVHIKPDDLKLTDELISKLPPTLKNYINYVDPLTDAPTEFFITPFLATAGAVIGKSRYVEVGGITIYPTIWTVLFAGSSTERKTTALNNSKKPFKKVQEVNRKEHNKKLQKWIDDKKAAEDEGEPFDEPKPEQHRIYAADGFSDLTFWEDLSHNGSLISHVGEFTNLWIELTRSRNSMKDLALAIFDAGDSIRRNTRSGGDIELQNPVWCIAGATTLSSFQQSLSSTERGSGLLQRILPVCVENGTKAFKALTELPRPNAELYNRLNENMLKLKDLDTEAVTISNDARERFTEWSHDLHNRAKKLSNSISDIGRLRFTIERIWPQICAHISANAISK